MTTSRRDTTAAILILTTLQPAASHRGTPRASHLGLTTVGNHLTCTHSAVRHPFRAGDPEEFGVTGTGSSSGIDGFLELDPTAFSVICDATCPTAQAGFGDDDTTTTAQDLLDDDALGTVDDDGGELPRSFTTAPTSTPTAAPTSAPSEDIIAAPTAPPTTVAPASAEDTPRSSPSTTAGPSSAPTTGGDDAGGEEGGDAESRAAGVTMGYTVVATGVFSAILGMLAWQ